MYCTCRIYAISVKLSPEKSSSGIKCLEASNFKICCFQTLTGNQMHENSVGLLSTYNIRDVKDCQQTSQDVLVP